MSAEVLTFARRRPVEPHRRPIAPHGGDVYVCHAQGGGFTVYDVLLSGGSAGLHGDFDSHAEAVTEGQRIAAAIDGTFHDLTGRGSTA